LRRQLGLPVEATIVIYTGRLVTYKGLPLLLRVWQDIQPPSMKTPISC
jgi:glycosyltransferase involved in cell wall biosynthesis